MRIFKKELSLYNPVFEFEVKIFNGNECISLFNQAFTRLKVNYEK